MRWVRNWLYKKGNAKAMRIGILATLEAMKSLMMVKRSKTIAIYDALKRYGLEDVDRIDTYYIKKNPFIFVSQFLNGGLRDKKYIVLLSSNGRKVLFPVLSFMSRYMNKDVYHYGIGGRLAREVEEKPKWKKYVSSFKGNWMESIELADQLTETWSEKRNLSSEFQKTEVDEGNGTAERVR